MEIILSFLIGAAVSAGALTYWQRKKKSEPDVKIQGGGGPGEEAPGP